MHTFLDAKLMAQSLRQALAVRKIALSLANWNVLAARIEATTDTSVLRLPRHWSITNQTNQKQYRLGLDPLEASTALIESQFQRGSGVDLSGDNYACLMQSVLADNLTGQRARLLASSRTGCGCSFDLDARRSCAGQRAALRQHVASTGRRCRSWHTAMDGMQYRARRTRDAASIHYGLLLKGHGHVWARQFQLEPVGADVATTAGHGRYLERPSNLGFSEGRPDA